MGNGNSSGRRGGLITMVVVGGYLVLRFGFVAWREHEAGMSTAGVIGTLALYAVGIFVVLQIVLGIQNARTRQRETALAQLHPGATLVPVQLKRDLVVEIRRTAGMLGTAPDGDVPRRGLATLVADHQGLGLYVGGRTPRLLLGIPRSAVRSVGNGETSAAGRYAFGTVDALRVTVDNGQWTAVDLPLYRTVIGFAKTLRGEELSDRVRTVAVAAGVRQDAEPRAGL
ncbi:hypothetical protein [Curtobacterium sp. MMLR14_010]|uniref:hypothetical protein n=1 Tax=Curtobacterium sp. MMLR14_010 TaxID=1898743 RepID=UPI000B16F9FD|nr:hypothetical protein [Curtobacterium sp. MMLR14_010]